MKMFARPRRPVLSADERRRKAAEEGKALSFSVRQALKKAVFPTKEDAGKTARAGRLGR